MLISEMVTALEKTRQDVGDIPVAIDIDGYWRTLLTLEVITDNEVDEKPVPALLAMW